MADLTSFQPTYSISSLMSQPLARAQPAKPRRKEWLLYSSGDSTPASANRLRNNGIRLSACKLSSATFPQRSILRNTGPSINPAKSIQALKAVTGHKRDRAGHLKTRP
ncbi:hypothetical protein D9M73_167630 [compost metagenome]